MSASGPVEIPHVVVALAETLRAILGDRLVAVYLGGSYTMGDFVEGVSDYDVLVVTAEALSGIELVAIGEGLDELRRADPEADRLEGDLAPLDWLSPEGTTRPVPFFVDGRLQPEPELMLSADNIANIRHDGIAVFGPPPADLLPAVSADQVRAAVREMLDDEDSCATEQDAAAAAVDLVRGHRALRTGMPTTKSDGLRWALGALGPSWQPLLQQAEAARRGAPVAADGRIFRDAVAKLRVALDELA